MDPLVFLENPYVFSCVVLVVFFVFAKAVHVILRGVVLKLTSKTKTTVDDRIVERTNTPITILIFLAGAYIAFLPFQNLYSHFELFQQLQTSVVILVVTYIIGVLLDIAIDSWGLSFAKKTKSVVDKQLLDLFHRFSNVIVYVVGILVILPVWGVEIAPMLASLGIAGIAIAFALQPTLSNIFGGMSLIIDKTYKVGDVVELDDKTMGEVIEVGLRSTRIQTWDNEVVVVPNGKLSDSRVRNFYQPVDLIRGIVYFGVEYGSKTDHVRKVTLETVKKHKMVLKEPEPTVEMLEMGDFALKYRATFWVEKFDYRFDTKNELTEDIYNAFQKEGIGIPFPTRTVHLKEGKKD